MVDKFEEELPEFGGKSDFRTDDIENTDYFSHFSKIFFFRSAQPCITDFAFEISAS